MNAQTAEKPAVLGARMGLYAGLSALIFFIILYFFSPAMLITPVILLGFIIVVIFKVVTSYYFWKSRRGAVDFKEALQSVFVVSAVSLAMIVFFFYLVFNFIDPSLTEQMKENMRASAIKAFEDGSITREQLDAAEKKAGQFNLGAGAFFTMYSFTLFIGFFYALVFAGITRLIGKDLSRKIPEIHN